MLSEYLIHQAQVQLLRTEKADRNKKESVHTTVWVFAVRKGCPSHNLHITLFGEVVILEARERNDKPM